MYLENQSAVADQAGMSPPQKILHQVHTTHLQYWPSGPRGLVGPAEGYPLSPVSSQPGHVHVDPNLYPCSPGGYRCMQMPDPHHPIFNYQPTFVTHPQVSFPSPTEGVFWPMALPHRRQPFPTYPMNGMPGVQLGPPPPPQLPFPAHPIHSVHSFSQIPLGVSPTGPAFPRQSLPFVAPMIPLIHVSPPPDALQRVPSRERSAASASRLNIEEKTRPRKRKEAIRRPGTVRKSHVGPLSRLLHQFRTQVDRKWELKELRGHIAEFCSDQYGSRFVQDAIEGADPLELDMVFEETVSNNVVEVSKDIYGNYVVQRILEHGSESHVSVFLGLLLGHIRELSFHVYGCRVVQKLIDVIAPEEQAQVVRELEPHVAACVRDAHGNHVVQKILEVVPSEYLQFADTFIGHAVEFAKHSYGCRVLQRCIQHLPTSQGQALLQEVMAHAFELISDQFGNYVIQYLLEQGGEQQKSHILSLIQGRLVKLSQHKHASNVCERALQHSSLEVRQQLIDEILALVEHHPRGVWTMIHDQYGNYVLQRAMALAEGYQKSVLYTIVERLLLEAWSKHPSEIQCKHLAAIGRILERNGAPRSRGLKRP